MDAWVEEMGDDASDRRCSNCFYFREGKDGFLPGSKAFTGRCTHPARQLPCEPQPFVRERELACRLEWDGDLYKEKGSDVDRVLDVRTIDPETPGPGSNGKPRKVLQRLLILSDRIPLPAVRDERIGVAIAEDGATPLQVDLLHYLWRRHR